MLEELTLYRIRVFATIVEQQSFLRAAEVLRVSQPAVSGHLRSLEDKLQCTLIERKRGGRLRLTEPGNMLFQYARRVLEETRAVEQSFVQLQAGTGGSIQLGANFTIGNYLLPKPLFHFKQSFPDVEVIAHIEIRELVAQHLQTSLYNMGIIIADPLAAGLELEAISQAEVVIAAPAQHPLAGYERIAPEELTHYPFVIGLRHSLFHRHLTVLLESRNIRIQHVTLELGDEAAQKRAVLAGAGIAALYRHCIQKEVDAGELVCLPVQTLPVYMPIYLAYRKNYEFTPLEARFLRFLRIQLALLRPHPKTSQPEKE